MPAVRLSSRRASAVGRRRSSLATSFAKPGNYGYNPASPTSATVTFAPNVTPTTYCAPSRTPSPFGSPSLTTDMPLPIFPPSETPAPPPTRKRQPPGKRRSQGYIPRPPNAFMLFRADFVRQKHVPGTIETNHGSLSKIIGNCWRSLPLPEKHIWEVKAKHAKAEHKLKYPDYKFRPVHNKQRGATSSSSSSSAAPARVQSSQPPPIKGQLSLEEDERRCEEVAALLLQGKKGQELASAVRDLDERRHPTLLQSSPPSPGPYEQHNSKYPHPLQLDPMYFPEATSSPPSSTFTSSYASNSGAGSPYSLPTPLQDGQEQTWRHRRSSSVPLPNEYSSYTFPPFMYEQQGNAMGLTLPPINAGGGYSSNSFPLPPPPSSADDSLAGLPMPISDNSRMSFAWTGNSSFSYPRPSFGFGFGGARPSFSYGGAWNSPLGRRASSAQAFFSPTSLKFAEHQHQHHQQADEELPDADTSLFDSGYLHAFPGAAHSHSSPPSNEGVSVSPFESAILHAPQPIHPMSSPLGVEFAEQQQQAYEQQQPQVYMDDETPSAPEEHSHSQQQQHEYPPFEFPSEHEPLSLSFQSSIRTSLDISPTSSAFEEISYASEFV
ncbi:hypothetical protein C8F01DRAFT_1127487 [Mycena amicta]|nr:hypothetical protein C8F01DRAFT_1127487 [Mycena amicta]